MYSNYLIHRILLEAGLPPSVIQFVPGDAELVTSAAIESCDFAALHYTGSTKVFKELSVKIAQRSDLYRSYPRLVGETGGKNFHLVHSSADVDSAVINTVRAAFEYSGQKCSACSRLYVSRSVWEAGFETKLHKETQQLTMGAPEDWSTFVGPVIHKASFEKLQKVIRENNGNITSLEDQDGYFISPQILTTTNPHSALLRDELFGPILAVYIYEDDKFDETLALVDSTSAYALTGSIFASDRRVIAQATTALQYAAGNFYINAK